METLTLLLYTARALRRLADERLRELGLYGGQEAVLFALFARDGQTQAELARVLRVQPPTVAKMVAHLEQARMVARRADRIDRRAKRVYLTAYGERLRAPLEEVWAALTARALNGLDAERQRQLGEALAWLWANMDGADDGC